MAYFFARHAQTSDVGAFDFALAEAGLRFELPPLPRLLLAVFGELDPFQRFSGLSCTPQPPGWVPKQSKSYAVASRHGRESLPARREAFWCPPGSSLRTFRPILADFFARHAPRRPAWICPFPDEASPALGSDSSPEHQRRRWSRSRRCRTCRSPGNSMLKVAQNPTEHTLFPRFSTPCLSISPRRQSEWHRRWGVPSARPAGVA